MRLLPVVAIACIPLVATSAAAQSANDGFDPGVNGDVRALAVDSEGRILVGGDFTTLADTVRLRLGRLSSFGELDPTFDPGADATVRALAVQADGKILIGGDFTLIGGGSGTEARRRLARLHPDGTVDGTFDPGANGSVNAIVLQSDGRIVVAGLFTLIGGGGSGSTPRNRIARLHPDGSIDGSFDPDANGLVSAIAIQWDGAVLIGGEFTMVAGEVRQRLARITAAGAIDAAYNPGANGAVTSIVAQPDGRSVVAGHFTMLGGGTGTVPRSRLGRLHRTGQVDPSFTANANAAVLTMASQPDGHLVVGGEFTTLGIGTGQSRARVGLVTADGVLVPHFNPGASDAVRAALILPNGGIVLGGSFTTIGTTSQVTRNRLCRLYPRGTLDRTLGGPTGLDFFAYPDGRLFSTFVDTFRETDGAVGWNGTAQPNGIYAVARQPDGRTVIGGWFTTVNGVPRNYLARLMPDGQLDASFDPGANGYVNAIALQPDGRILVGGSFTTLGGGSTGTNARQYLGRLNADGTIDQTFDPGADAAVGSIAVRPTGEILIGGSFTMAGGGTGTSPCPRICQLTGGGSISSAFQSGADGSVFDIRLQPTGEAVVSGAFEWLGPTGHMAFRNGVGRLNVDGSVDTNFVPDSAMRLSEAFLQANGQVMVVSRSSAAFRNHRRLQGDGTTDAAFFYSTEGFGRRALQRDGKLIAAGQIDNSPFPLPSFYVRRLTNTIAALEELRVTDGGAAVLWTRRGSAPEIHVAAIELAVNDGPFSPLGVASWNGDAWQLSGLNLPANERVTIRAIGLGDAGMIAEAALRTYIDAAPAITMHPIDQTVPVNAPVSFTVEVGDPDAEFRWQVSGDGGTSWTNLTDGAPYAGTGGSTLFIQSAPDTFNGLRYRVAVTHSGGESTSGSALLTVLPTPVDLITNGSFAGGMSGWLTYATPDMSYIAANLVDGVMSFYRIAPPAGTSNQAVAFQPMGVALASGSSVLATFDLGNSSTVRKRIGVLVHDADFSDLAVCTFWIAPNTSLATYRMALHTTKAWTSATISFYAATTGSDGGQYLLDNVSVQFLPTGPITRTDCLDPASPAPGIGTSFGVDLPNGDFENGLDGWGVYGQIAYQLTNGVFEFIREAGQPSGVILRPANVGPGIDLPAGQILAATFDLGNSSTERKRVTVLLHDNAFSDLAACTFWLEPGVPLRTYAMRMFLTKPWLIPWISIYPATVGPEPWIRLDNVTVKATPNSLVAGTECIEPSGTADALVALAEQSAQQLTSEPWLSSGRLISSGHAAHRPRQESTGVHAEGSGRPRALARRVRRPSRRPLLLPEGRHTRLHR
jgi:uncharacterized delta-60 repeat protein